MYDFEQLPRYQEAARIVKMWDGAKMHPVTPRLVQVTAKNMATLLIDPEFFGYTRQWRSASQIFPQEVVDFVFRMLAVAKTLEGHSVFLEGIIRLQYTISVDVTYINDWQRPVSMNMTLDEKCLGYVPLLVMSYPAHKEQMDDKFNRAWVEKVGWGWQ